MRSSASVPVSSPPGSIRMAELRSLQTLARQKSEIVWFLRATVSRDEAEAMCSAGYRPDPCGCGRYGCRHCDSDPSEQIRAGRHGRPDPDPRYVREVLHRVSAFPAYLYAGVPRELARLDPQERLVLMLNVSGGLSPSAVATRLRLHRATVHRLREAALATLCRAIWDEEGAPKYEGG